MPKTSEFAFNTALANVLRRKHPRWPDRIGVEQTDVFSETSSEQPDMIVGHQGGVPVVIETEYMPARTVERDARSRLGRTLRKTGDKIEQVLAVRIPEKLATADQGDLETEIENAEFHYCLLSGDTRRPDRWPENGWLKGNIDDFATCIEATSLSENRVAQSIRIFEWGIEQAAGKLREEHANTGKQVLEKIAEELHQKDNEQTSRMAMAIIANAFTFHCTIAGTHNIKTFDDLRDDAGHLVKSVLLREWRRILNDVNYWPIFKIACDILSPINNRTATVILDRLSDVAEKLELLGTTSQHDLCGRMFQRLITDRKFLATFYTLPGSATLLAELAVPRLDIDWSDVDAVTKLRIADFACGTGALLYASYNAVLARYRRTGADDEVIHPQMMEEAIVGADIMPAATHLTASILSSAHPSIVFRNTSIVTLPYGAAPDGVGGDIAIGSLDLIKEDITFPIFETGHKQVSGMGDENTEMVELPHKHYDLVIMNPPFTSSTNHAVANVPIPSFSGFSTGVEESRLMSEKLKSMDILEQVGDARAGLGSNFMDLAHVKVKEKGTIAFVLLASFLKGKSWAKARKLLAKHYDDIMIVSIVGGGKTNRAFSADTDLAEVLIIADRKEANWKNKKRDNAESKVLYVNLWSRPQSILEATTLARNIREIPDEGKAGPLMIGDDIQYGSWIRGTLDQAGHSGVRETNIVRCADLLAEGTLSLPQFPETILLPMTELQELGVCGFGHRSITAKRHASTKSDSPFDIMPLVDGETPTYPVLWGHGAERERNLTVEADSQGLVRDGYELRAEEIWKTATRLHFTLDFRMTSQSLAACVTPEKCIGGRAWPSFVCESESWEIPLVLWANSTLGLIAFWRVASRQQLGRPCITITRLPELNILDPRALDETKLGFCTEIFEEFRNKSFLPAVEARYDDTRQELDRVMLVDLLGVSEDVLEPLNLLRRQWCDEPSVGGGKSPVSMM